MADATAGAAAEKPAATVTPSASAASAGAPVSQEGMVMEAILNLLGEDELKTKIDGIKSQRKAVSEQKRKLTNEMRNEKRKQDRLVKKSAGLKTPDLLKVLRLREEKDRAKKAAAAALG